MTCNERNVKVKTDWSNFLHEKLLSCIAWRSKNGACRSPGRRVIRVFGIGIPLIVIVFMLIACNSNEEVELQSEAQNGSTWETEITQRRQNVKQAILQDRLGFDAYDTGSLGDATLEMIPFVVFRVLQELEPSILGDDALKSYGFFARNDTPSGLNGITWTRPIFAAENGKFKLRYMTRTCASCHTGRVRLANGDIRIVNGGTNTEINLHLFVGKLTDLLEARLTDSNNTPQYLDFRERIIDMLKQKDTEWYWGEGSQISAADAKKEVATVAANIDAVLTQMRIMNIRRLKTLELLQKHSYDKAQNSPSLVGGAPGIIETAGLGSAALIPLVGEDKANLVLPPGPSKADIPAVWDLDAGGYANWDATIKAFSRALTSSLAVVGDLNKVDLAWFNKPGQPS